jgi:hypothetical protein
MSGSGGGQWGWDHPGCDSPSVARALHLSGTGTQG